MFSEGKGVLPTLPIPAVNLPPPSLPAAAAAASYSAADHAHAGVGDPREVKSAQLHSGEAVQCTAREGQYIVLRGGEV